MIDKNRMDSAKIIEAAVIGKQESMNERAVNRDATFRNHLRSRGIIESRGSAMLKAALVDKSRHENKAPTGRSHMDNAATCERQERDRMKKQLADLSNQKRTTKKSVLFTEPLVTQLYEYEQARIPDVQETEETPENGSKVISFKRKYWEVADAQPHELRAHLIIPNKKKRAWTTTTYNTSALEKKFTATLKNDLDRYVHLSDKHSNGGFGCSSDDDDEHHDMLVIEAAHQEIGDKTTRESANRSRENIDDFSNDESQPNKPSPGSDGKSLFFSPKVAKVAPYFEEKSQEDDANAAAKCNQDCLGLNQDDQVRSISKDYFPGFNLIASSFKYLSNQFNKLIY